MRARSHGTPLRPRPSQRVPRKDFVALPPAPPYLCPMTSLLTQHTEELLRLARQGRDAAASAKIQSFLSALESELGSLPQRAQQEIMALFATLLRLQEHRDWVAYADVLEYELLPILKER
jgi:hypothetical protein